MVKKSRSRQRGIQKGVKKHKIRNSQTASEGLLYFIESLIPPHYLEKFYKLAENCLSFYTKTVCRLCLVPLILTEDGKLAKAPLKKLLIHYLLQGIFMLSMLHKMAVLFYRLAYDELGTMTFVCAATVLCYLVAFSLSASCLFLQDETTDIINGWPEILDYYSNEDDGIKLKIINNTKIAIVVTSLAGLAMVIGFVVSTFFSVLHSEHYQLV